ncbi:hypothetical protein ACP4OV_027150 [Aristida adscensionis]
MEMVELASGGSYVQGCSCSRDTPLQGHMKTTLKETHSMIVLIWLSLLMLFCFDQRSYSDKRIVNFPGAPTVAETMQDFKRIYPLFAQQYVASSCMSLVLCMERHCVGQIIGFFHASNSILPASGKDLNTLRNKAIFHIETANNKIYDFNCRAKL